MQHPLLWWNNYYLILSEILNVKVSESDSLDTSAMPIQAWSQIYLKYDFPHVSLDTVSQINYSVMKIIKNYRIHIFL